MAEFTLDGRQFRVGKMDMMRRQLHVLRRLAPASFELMKIFRGLSSGLSGEVVLIATFDDWSPILAKMTDADVDYILDACLETVMVNLNGLWVNLLPVGGKLADPDLTTIEAFKIMGAVLQETFVPFFLGLASKSPDTGPKTEAPVKGE